MGSVWLCMPSARPPEQVEPILRLWRERGYRIALWLDPGAPLPGYCDITMGMSSATPYPGYAAAVNALALEVLHLFSGCNWIVSAGDDTEPDATHTAQEIEQSIWPHFCEVNRQLEQAATGRNLMKTAENNNRWDTFGVMQPTGDRWGDHRDTHPYRPHYDASGRCIQCGHMKDHHRHSVGAYIDRVAGSPWMGREFCLRVNQGRGPLWPEYFHMGCDEELQAVATRLEVFWQRPDLTHLHKHWGRGLDGKLVDSSTMPEFLKRANSIEEWNQYKKLFAEREAAGFPGSEPL